MNNTASTADQTPAYLNGSYLPLSQASISPLDRGFIFGDGVYEVIPVYGRKPFRLEGHLQRLDSSLRGIRLPNPHTQEQWAQIIDGVIARCPHEDQSLYLQVTRGVAKRDHAFPKDTAPTVFLMANALATPGAESVREGVAAVTAADIRWLRCDLKTIALLPNVLLRQLAVDAGAVETVLLRDGYLTEGAASNIFVVKDGVLLIPPKTHLILPGITYDVILELAEQDGMRCEVREVTEAEVRSAQELWLSSSTREVLSITKLDGNPVGDGRPGPLFRRMFALFQELKARLRHSPGAPAHA
ncbi:MAG TPA: D-amino acid aminotransferase [Burkholderiales bacterium]|nr:D-amino acid aminotransferase [Burkholderiales bacterium]